MDRRVHSHLVRAVLPQAQQVSPLTFADIPDIFKSEPKSPRQITTQQTASPSKHTITNLTNSMLVILMQLLLSAFLRQILLTSHIMIGVKPESALYVQIPRPRNLPRHLRTRPSRSKRKKKACQMHQLYNDYQFTTKLLIELHKKLEDGIYHDIAEDIVKEFRTAGFDRVMGDIMNAITPWRRMTRGREVTVRLQKYALVAKGKGGILNLRILLATQTSQKKELKVRWLDHRAYVAL